MSLHRLAAAGERQRSPFDREMFPAGRERFPMRGLSSWCESMKNEFVRRSPPAVVMSVWFVAMLSAVVSAVWIEVLAGRIDGSGATGNPQSTVVSGAALLTIGAVGAFAASRSGHRAAWLLVAIASSLALSLVTASYAAYGVVIDPGALPGARWLTPFGDLFFFLSYPLVAMLLLITPTGSPASPAWRWLARCTAGAASGWVIAALFGGRELAPPLDGRRSPYAIRALESPLAVLMAVSVAVSLIGVLAAIVSLVVRFRRSVGVVRQQLRWVAFGAAAASGWIVVAIVAGAVGSLLIQEAAATAGVVTFAVCIGVSIARFRLYTLDRLITRSFVYGLLLVGVGAVYVAIVVTITALAGSSAVGAGVAALTAALTVSPLRRLVERAIDRTMFGSRSDPFATVSELNRRLQESESPDVALQVLVQSVADSLRLPYVAVETHDGTVVAASGDPGPSPVIRFALVHQGDELGSLVLSPHAGDDDFDERDHALVADLARHAGSVAHSAMWVRDLERSRRDLVAAQQDERRRLRRDLHDGLGPQLTAVTLKADAARNFVRTRPDRAEELLAELRADTREALDDLRRLVYGLRPPALDDVGLAGAVREYAARLEIGGRLHVVVTSGPLPPLPAAVEVAAYRIATEAVTNTARHSEARNCCVNLCMDRGLRLSVEDDGHGLPTGWKPGIGVASMRERVAELGGVIDFATGVLGSGLVINALLPVESL
jgi:signal transduction histidine kinase